MPPFLFLLGVDGPMAAPFSLFGFANQLSARRSGSLRKTRAVRSIAISADLAETVRALVDRRATNVRTAALLATGSRHARARLLIYACGRVRLRERHLWSDGVRRAGHIAANESRSWLICMACDHGVLELSVSTVKMGRPVMSSQRKRMREMRTSPTRARKACGFAGIARRTWLAARSAVQVTGQVQDEQDHDDDARGGPAGVSEARVTEPAAGQGGRSDWVVKASVPG